LVLGLQAAAKDPSESPGEPNLPSVVVVESVVENALSALRNIPQLPRESQEPRMLMLTPGRSLIPEEEEKPVLGKYATGQ
jgi:hypothetical protein